MRIRRSIYTLILAAVTAALLLTACQPTPETAPVQNKSGSLIDVISGNYDYEPENAAALNGQAWNEQVYKQDDITVTVDAQITTQDVQAYPAVRVKADNEKFMKGAYLQKMLDYFFAGDQPYYRFMEPSQKEAAIRLYWYQQYLSSGDVPESELESVNMKLANYEKELKTASDDIPFDIKKDPNGEKYKKETGMNNNFALVSYPSEGLAFVDLGDSHLAFSKQTSVYNNYGYEIGLDSLTDAPKSIDFDAENALEIAKDSVDAIAEGESMELVRMATICRTSETMPEATDIEKLDLSALFSTL